MEVMMSAEVVVTAEVAENAETQYVRFGFTLVELLVVISIIAMLAGLILPAVNAARENGKRTQCVNNQRQVAFALLNFEGVKGSFPALRAPLTPSEYPCSCFTGDRWDSLDNIDATELTWIGFLLPFMEQNMAWDFIKSGCSDDTLFDLVIPVMQCKSGSISSGQNRISYVANAGPLNPNDIVHVLPSGGHSTNSTSVEFGRTDRSLREAKMYTIFFDHFSGEGQWSDVQSNAALCSTKISLNNISVMDGTSTTILVSENDNAGNWIWQAVGVPVASTHVAVSNDEDLSEVESLVGFCYPNILRTDAVAGEFEVPVYIPLQSGTDQVENSPLFINEGRSALTTYRTRTARPSSGYPGIVNAAFCDGGVRPLKEDMAKPLFVQLCRPGSRGVLNLKSLGW
jgi:prepilin-type N-terminal cleavage/methylation domain-containing protein